MLLAGRVDGTWHSHAPAARDGAKTIIFLHVLNGQISEVIPALLLMQVIEQLKKVLWPFML
ncbi:MAG: hypothetical protein EAZ89_14640 [Bacteroidetes bacterium]|nr:MAG: hypothetical protein EAZ89_14640 [Bacteroidota bacterium]